MFVKAYNDSQIKMLLEQHIINFEANELPLCFFIITKGLPVWCIQNFRNINILIYPEYKTVN